MSEVLSQNEIDEFLRALNTGELDVEEIEVSKEDRKIKKYDFRRPIKFAKDHIRTLYGIHEDYARLMTNYLTAYLRAFVQIDVKNIEALVYSDFNDSIPTPSIMTVVDMAPLQGLIVIKMDAKIAYAIVDKVLGGSGHAPKKITTFTELELSMIEKVMKKIISSMTEPWENVIDLNPRFDRIETNPQFARIATANEMVALATLSVTIGDIEGMINVCLPYVTLEPIIPKLSSKFGFLTIERGITEETKRQMENKIYSSKVSVKSVLGKTRLTVNEIVDLQIGDVLTLNTEINDSLEVIVENVHKFNGKLGVRKNKLSLQITDIIREEG